MSSEPSDEWAREGFQGQSCQFACSTSFGEFAKAHSAGKRSRTTVACSSTNLTAGFDLRRLQSHKSDELL